jgi:hypothetical protein
MDPNTNTILSQTSGATNSLRDIRPPVEIASVWAWLWWVLGIMLAAALIAFLWWRYKNRKLAAPAIPAVPPHVRARQQLEYALTLIRQPKPFCILVSDTVRIYLEERFHFRAPERTTEEFLHELGSTNLLLPDQKESLAEFLKGCDLVKFARHEPHETDLKRLHDAAVRLVDETEPLAEGTETTPSVANESSSRTLKP